MPARGSAQRKNRPSEPVAGIVCSRDEAHRALRVAPWRYRWRFRWITTTGVKHLAEADLADAAARSEGVIWVHLDHSDEHGMALLVEMINPRTAFAM